MPNEYSIAIHAHLTRVIETTEAELETAQKAADISAASYYQGKLDELDWIRAYLRKNSDLKDFVYYPKRDFPPT